MLGHSSRYAWAVCILGSLLLFVGHSWADPPNSETNEDRSHALVEEEIVVFEARLATAQLRLDRAEEYFMGTRSLEGAFPDWSDRPLDDTGYLLGLRFELNRSVAERAEERTALDPVIEDEGLSERLAQARNAAFDAEDLADMAEQRFIGGILAGLERAPHYSEPEIRAALERYARARDAIPDPDTEEESSTEDATDIVRWANAEAHAREIRRAVLRVLTVPGATDLEEIIPSSLEMARDYLEHTQAVLEDSPLGPLPEDYGLIERLGWLSGLVSDETENELDGIRDRYESFMALISISELEQELERVEAELAMVEQETPAEDPDLEMLSAAIEEAREFRANLEEQRVQGEDESLELRIRIALVRESIATARLESAEEAASRVMEQAATNQQELEEAQARLEEARRLAEVAREEEDRATAVLREQVFEFSGTAAEILLEEVGSDENPGRSVLVRQRVAALESALEDARMSASAALGMGPLVPGRQDAIDAAWNEIRDIVDRIREEVWSQYTTRAEVLAELRAIRDSLPAASRLSRLDQDDSLVEEWQDALAALHEVLDKREQNLTIELDATLDLLTLAKSERRQIRHNVSAEAISSIQRSFLVELFAELREFPLQLSRDGRSWQAILGNMGAVLLDFSIVGAAILGLLEIFVLLGIWLFFRRSLASFMERFAERCQELRSKPESEQGVLVPFLTRKLEHGNFAKGGVLLGTFAVDLFAFVIVGLCLVVLGDRLWLIGLLFMIWQIRNTLRVGVHSTTLLFAGPGQEWPCWRRISEKQRQLLHRTVWWFCFLASMEWLAHGVALDIMDADRLNDLVHVLSRALMILLAYVFLGRWAEDIRSAVLRRGNDRFTPMMANAWGLRFLRPFQAFAGSIYILALILFRTTVQLLGSRRGLTWITARVIRVQLKDTKDQVESISEDVRNRLITGATEALDIDRELEELGRLYREWSRDPRRGLIALTGDRGAGKSRLMAHLSSIFDAEQENASPIDMVRIQCPQRSMNEEESLVWLAESLGLELESPDRVSLVAALENHPPTLWAVDDLHRSFRRSVGGFEGLVSLLDAMYATSRRHFWILNIHEPAWAYLKGVPGAVNLAVFRERVMIRRLEPSRARTWLEGRAESAGIRLDYGKLVGESLPGVDLERALSRARDAFWRLLVQFSQGNPRIALQYWTNSLCAHEQPDAVHTVLFDAPAPADLSDVGDLELFVLTALIIHDGLHLDDLAAVLNLAEGECHRLCSQLEARGVLHADDYGSRFSVELGWLPAVERTLQQKHFLYAQA